MKIKDHPTYKQFFKMKRLVSPFRYMYAIVVFVCTLVQYTGTILYNTYPLVHVE